MTALIRNLATMTRVGLLEPGSTGTAEAVARLGDAERIRARARAPDRGARRAPDVRVGPRRSRPERRGGRSGEIVDALDAAFYTSFANVEPTGKRLLLALDVSGSMEGGRSPACRVSRRATQRPRSLSSRPRPSADYEIVGFFAGRDGWKAGDRRQ